MSIQSIELETFLARQKEVFKCYIEHNGREIDLLPLMEEYSQKDNKVYTIEDMLHYIETYCASELATEEEKLQYNNSKKMPAKLVFERGKEIVETLIHSKGSWEECLPLALKYTEEDGRIRVYKETILKKFRRFFLEKCQNKELLQIYKAVMKLAQRENTDGYDIELINQLLSFYKEDFFLAVKFVQEICISKTTLEDLRRVYNTLYPANKNNLLMIDNIIEAAYPKNNNHPQGAKLDFVAVRKQRIRDLMEAYLVRDIEDPKELKTEFHLNNFHYQEALKEARASKDKVLLGLVDNFDAKQRSIYEMKKSIVDKVFHYITNGINYGNGYRQYNSFDVYTEFDIPPKDIVLYANKVASPGQRTVITEFFNKITVARIYDNPDDLYEKIDYQKGNRKLTDEEKTLIISFMEQKKWPYIDKLFLDTAKRYLEGDLVIQVELRADTELFMNKR